MFGPNSIPRFATLVIASTAFAASGAVNYASALHIDVPNAVVLEEVAAGDLDGDGKADVLFRAMEWVGSNAQYRFWRTTGVPFVSAVGLMNLGLVASSPQYVELVDLDGDTRLDLQYVINGSGGYQVEWRHGNGDGSFAAPIVITSGSQGGRRSRVIDLDADGDADIVLDYSSVVHGDPTITNTFQVLRNDGGSFVALAPFSFTGSAFSNVFVDYDADGDLDLHYGVAAGNDYAERWLPGDGANGFGAPIDVTALPGSPYGVAVVDFDVDGIPDLVRIVSSFSSGPFYELYRFEVWRGQGGGVYALAGTVAVPQLRNLKAVDLDADARLEVIARAEHSSDGWTFIIKVSAAGIPTIVPAPRTGYDAIAADLDGDGRMDLVGTYFGYIRLLRGIDTPNRPPVNIGTTRVYLDPGESTMFAAMGTDPDDNLLTYRVGSPPSKGTVWLDSGDGTVEYQAGMQSSGNDEFSVEVTDYSGSIVTIPYSVHIFSTPGGGGTVDLAWMALLGAAAWRRRRRSS